MILSKICFP